MICDFKSRSESTDSRTRSRALIWIKWFSNPLRSPDLNQMILEPAPKSRSESNDSRTRSGVLIWIKWFSNPLRSPDLNQMILEPVPIWIKWFSNPLRSPDLNQMILEPAPESRSESNDSRTRSGALIWIKWFSNPLRSPDLNQMILEPAPESWSESNDSRTRSGVPIWIKWFSNPLRSPDLNQMICDPIGAWLILWCSGLTDSEFWKAPFHPSIYVFFYIHYKQCWNMKINGSFDLVLLVKLLIWIHESESIGALPP